MVDEYGAEYLLLSFANEGASHARWWAGPHWAQFVETFTAQLSADPPGISVRELRLGLLAAPDTLNTVILDWCTSVQLIGYTRLVE